MPPRTAFYVWVYINALHKDAQLRNEVALYDAFTDIEFNPERSVNCEARSAALYCILLQTGRVEEALSSSDIFRETHKEFVGDPYGFSHYKELL